VATPRGRVRSRAALGSRSGTPRWLPLGLAAAALLAAGAYILNAGSRSADAVARPLATLSTSDFHALTFGPNDPGALYFGHHNGIMQSIDGGRTWRALVDRRNFDAMGLAVSGGASASVYLAGHDIFQVSPDGGASWQPLVHNLPGTDIHGFAMSPDDPMRLFAFVVGHGAFSSPDGGQSWEQLAGPLPGDVMGMTATAGSPPTLYAASMGSGLWRSADGGTTWTSASNGLGSGSVLSVATDGRESVYAGTESGLYRSADRGSSWTRLAFPGENAVAVAVSPVQPNLVLAIAVKDRKGLVFRSDDGGSTWGGGAY